MWKYRSIVLHINKKAIHLYMYIFLLPICVVRYMRMHEAARQKRMYLGIVAVRLNAEKHKF